MLRIIAGEHRGRRITTPPGRGTRPTADQVREGLFNTLTHLIDLDGARIWDLYAGSGALGIEALSRGAAHVTFVEHNGKAAGTIKANLKTLVIPPQRAKVVTTRVERWLTGLNRLESPSTQGPSAMNVEPEGEDTPAQGTVDLVLLDPPYADQGIATVLTMLARCPLVAPDALVTVESARETPPPLPEGLEPFRVKRYGDIQIMILVRATEAKGAEAPISGASTPETAPSVPEKDLPEPPADPCA